MASGYSCCKECGAIFKSYIPMTYCDKHKYIDEEQFDKIEEYLGTHPFSNAIEINKATDISTTEILRYINEGKLRVVDGKVTVNRNSKGL